jgi:serine/threonine-protein kinase
MGAVYEATHTGAGKRVAVKVMHRGLAAYPELLARFRREAKVTSELAHPHVVNVFGFGTAPAGGPYLVMEFLEGEDLQTRLERVGALPLPTVVQIVNQVAGALAVAHAAGVVHRDLKPDNVFLVRAPDEAVFAKVVDFGLSKVLKTSATKLTVARAVFGTPEFMAPEQVQNAAGVTGACDVYSLTLVLFRMLSGRSPFDNCAGTAYLVAHVASPPRDVSDLVPGVDAALAALIARGLAKSPETRPGAAELAGLLTAIADRLETPGTEAVLAPVLDRPTPPTVDAPLSSATVRGRMPRT